MTEFDLNLKGTKMITEEEIQTGMKEIEKDIVDILKSRNLLHTNKNILLIIAELEEKYLKEII